MENKYEKLSLYTVDELSEQEKDQLERHLKTCIHCQHELASLQETWQALSYNIEEVDVPESLKAEVMDLIFEGNEIPEQAKKEERNSFIEQLKLILSKHFSPLSAGITIVLVIGLIGLFWTNLHLKDTITALENEVVDHTQIVTTYALSGQDLAASAYGKAYLLKEGNDTSLVIELKNMPSTNDDEVYQVWLLKNGNRQNAGTLKPDQNGNGIIAYRLPEDLSFDDIGITLEPNPYNTQPHGQKVMGTS
jgi:hypothetical protein